MLGAVAMVMLASDPGIYAASEGRSHLWSVGIQKFTERPLFGYGYESWRDDLVRARGWKVPLLPLFPLSAELLDAAYPPARIDAILKDAGVPVL